MPLRSAMTGFELIAAWRADDRLCQTPIIWLAASGAVEPALVALDAGADDYLIEPYLPRELLARVAARLRGQQRQRAAVAGLRANETHYRRIVEAASEGIWGY